MYGIGIDLREERHQEIMLLDISYTTIVPEFFSLDPVELDRSRDGHLRTIYPARNGIEKCCLA